MLSGQTLVAAMALCTPSKIFGILSKVGFKAEFVQSLGLVSLSVTHAEL